MLGLEFVVRSQKMRATQIPCDQAQILTSCISDGEPKCSRPAPTLGSMVALRLRVASCTSLHLNGCVRVLRLHLNGCMVAVLGQVRPIRLICEAFICLRIFPPHPPFSGKVWLRMNTCLWKYREIQHCSCWQAAHVSFVPHCMPYLVRVFV